MLSVQIICKYSIIPQWKFIKKTYQQHGKCFWCNIKWKWMTKKYLPRGKGKTSLKRRGSGNWLPPAWPTWFQLLISNFADAAPQTPRGVSAPFLPANSNPIPSSPINEVLPHLFERPFLLLWILSACGHSAPKLHLKVLVREVTLSSQELEMALLPPPSQQKRRLSFDLVFISSLYWRGCCVQRPVWSSAAVAATKVQSGLGPLRARGPRGSLCHRSSSQGLCVSA